MEISEVVPTRRRTGTGDKYLQLCHDGQDVRNVGNIHYVIPIDVGCCLVAIVCHDGQDVRNIGNVDNTIYIHIAPSRGEIARIVCATINVGVRCINVISIVLCAFAAHKAGAVFEHIRRRCYIICAPFVAYIDGFQNIAIHEHGLHIGHFGCIEVA